MTWPIMLQLQKLLSEISGYDTLSLGEGRGEATTWPSKFAYKSNLSMAEGWGEDSDLLSKFCRTSTIKPHLSMADGHRQWKRMGIKL